MGYLAMKGRLRMKLVTDSAADLPPDWAAEHNVSAVPLHMTWDNGDPADGIGRADFYARLATEHHPPKTSQPSIGEFIEVYRPIAFSEREPCTLSIHISSGLSGTVQSARAAAELVPEANVTVIDSLTLSGAQGWQVRAAARAAEGGDALEAVVDKVRRVREAAHTVYTLDTLHYLMLGGRIGRVKGTLGSLLHIKPLIAVDKEHGTYIQVGTGRSLKHAMRNLVGYVAQHVGDGAEIVAQVLHAEAPELAEQLTRLAGEVFDVRWLPTGEISPVLGAHTGPGLVGIAFAPRAALAGIELD
jgi:DegV family protein with EDD domain